MLDVAQFDHGLVTATVAVDVSSNDWMRSIPEASEFQMKDNRLAQLGCLTLVCGTWRSLSQDLATETNDHRALLATSGGECKLLQGQIAFVQEEM